MAENTVRVLLIEDNPGDARLIREMLSEVKSPRFEFHHSSRLSEGLQRMANGDIDVLLLDLGLPDSQGLDTLKRAHQTAPQIPVIVVTNLDDREVAVNAITQGAKDYMVKGKVDSYLLSRAIQRQLRPAAASTGKRDGAAD